MCVFIPSINEDRYVSTADNLRTLDKNSTASVIPFALATVSNVSKFCLDVLKPLADDHLADGGLNFNPANSFVGINK